MGILFAVLFLIYLFVSAVLVLVVLIQSGKGGGLSGLIGSGSSLGDTLGATGAEKTLNRWTSYCAIAFLVVNIMLVFLGPKVFKTSILDEINTDGTTQDNSSVAPVTEGTGTPGASSEPDVSPTPGASAVPPPTGSVPDANPPAPPGPPSAPNASTDSAPQPTPAAENPGGTSGTD